jgi:hypothetical protein
VTVHSDMQQEYAVQRGVATKVPCSPALLMPSFVSLQAHFGIYFYATYSVFNKTD